MRDAGVRFTRQRLLRYRPPEKPGTRAKRWLLIGLGVWAVWAVLLSDHSVAKLLNLRTERGRLANRLEEAKKQLARAEDDMIGAKPTDEQAERILRERHIFAKDDELVYVIGEDSVSTKQPR